MNISRRPAQPSLDWAQIYDVALKLFTPIEKPLLKIMIKWALLKRYFMSQPISILGQTHLSYFPQTGHSVSSLIQDTIDSYTDAFCFNNNYDLMITDRNIKL